MSTVIKRIATAFDAEGLEYTIEDSSLVTIVPGKHVDEIRIVMRPGYTGKGVSIGVYGIAVATKANQYQMAFTLNRLNNTYLYYKFYIDNNMNINCCYDVKPAARNIGAICVDSCDGLARVVDQSYRMILDAAKE